jgi:hypothetical protein
MDIETLRLFLGWVTVFNIGILLFSTLMVVTFKKRVAAIHGRMFSLKEEAVLPMYFQYLAQYKTLTLIFNLVPYLVLRLVM